MLDLKLIRRDPEGVRSALARRGASEAIDELLEADRRWRELNTRFEELKAEQNAVGREIGEAKRSGADAAAAVERSTALKAELGPLGEEVREADERVRSLLVSLPNLPDPDAPEQEDQVLREVGESGKLGKDHLELLGDRVDMERGARLSGSRFAYLKGDARPARVRAGPLGPGGAGLARLHAGGAAGARARGGALRHRLPARHRAADLPAARGRPVPGRHLGGAAGVAPRRRDPRGGRAAAPLRRLLHLLPARGGRRRQGHARDLPRAPVRQGRDVRVRPAGGLARRARAPVVDRGGAAAGARAPLPRGEHPGLGPRRLGREEVRPRGVAARPGPLPRADLVLEHHRLPGAPPRDPLPAGWRPARGGAHAERHRGGGRADDHRGRGEPPAGGRQHRRARRAPPIWGACR